MPIRRGADLDDELRNAERLLAGGAEELWGWGTPAGEERVRRRVEFIVREARLGPGVTALELGCGTGVFTRQVAASGARIVAVDLSTRLLDVARAHVPAGVELVAGDLMRPETLEGRTFDAFYCVSVLHHLDLDRALPAIAAHLRPGARFAVSEPNLDNPLNRWHYFTPDLERRARLGVSASEMAFTREELADALARHGFRPERVEHRDFLHPRTPRRLIPAVRGVEAALERLPGVRRLSGSLWCAGTFVGG
ncbi:MAG: class I SAM-dependent methyltransferase [Planctomycetota bacterium]|nr:class I SAM-dependent methyltransferase [Planctomycetota bacterium]